eukprot:m.193168 g.193168  ORF g.193168 m.193168 type:complete len:234 (+) comp18853_c0_seq1:55-756(+)
MDWFVVAVVVVVVLVVLMRTYSADVYDAVVTQRLTTPWYRSVLTHLKPGAEVLDVGIGTAVALVNNKDIVMSKDIKVVGIDYDAPYVAKATRVVEKAGLGDHIQVHCKSVYDTPLPAPLSGATQYDAVYFSGSITLMPDPPAALKAVAKLLKKNGAIYITQTFQRKAIPLLKYIKPLAYYVTTIDFGQVTYEADIARIVRDAGMEMEEYTELKDSVQTQFQTARMIVIRPHAT